MKQGQLREDAVAQVAAVGELFDRGEHYRIAAGACRRAIRLNAQAQAACITLTAGLLFLGRQDES
ncbi:MAG: hypothetical protein R6X14_09410 [bacterium]